ncbi:MAG: FTR1 family iron permease, partial [Actinomycetota bacterium]
TELPQRGQERLETVVGLIAVAIVTYMVAWMRSHARSLKSDLEAAAASALSTGTAKALVAMAFLAVLREGFETAVFLLAAFQASGHALASGIGAAAGIACAVALGYGIYKGGLRINLRRFFRVTGLVLVLIAAGLVMTAAHTASEAGWLSVGQAQALNLAWLVRPGSAVSSLVTGVLGVQPYPRVAEVAVWVAYLLPMAALVLWPGRRARRVVAVAATTAQSRATR